MFIIRDWKDENSTEILNQNLTEQLPYLNSRQYFKILYFGFICYLMICQKGHHACRYLSLCLLDKMPYYL